MNMEKIENIIKSRYKSIVNNDSTKNNDINGNNDSSKIQTRKYALNKEKFHPNTPETQLAEKIARDFNDLNNYACYLSVIKKIGVSESERLYRSTNSDIQEKRNTKYPVRNKAKYFMYKLKFKKF